MKWWQVVILLVLLALTGLLIYVIWMIWNLPHITTAGADTMMQFANRTAVTP